MSAPYLRIFRELVRPWDRAYSEDDSAARLRDLMTLWQRCERDPEVARHVVELTRRSFWAFLTLACVSVDEKSARSRTRRPAPPLRCYHDLANFLDERNADGTWKHPLVGVEKSRQLFISWFSILRLLWMGFFKPNADLPILSKDKEAGQLLVERVTLAYDVIPKWYLEAVGAWGAKQSVQRLRLPNRSRIDALPQRGGNAMRSRTPTGVLADEAAFCIHFRDNWGALMGAQDARAQCLAVSTAGPSTFQLLMTDEMDGRKGGRGTIYHRSVGLDLWRNRNNGLDCVRIHYTADPGRRSAEWRAMKMRGVLSIDQWNQEQEIQYDACAGKRVFPYLDRGSHVLLGRARVVRYEASRTGWGITVDGWMDGHGNPIIRPVVLYLGIDHGTTNPTAGVWVAVDDDGDAYVYRLYYEKGRLAPHNAREIARMCGDEKYRGMVADAAATSPIDGKSVLEIYRGEKIGDVRPLKRLELPKKGGGSREAGLQRIGSRLLATLAAENPASPYWGELAGPDPIAQAVVRDGYLTKPRLYLDASCEPLWEELTKARYDERTDDDPGRDQPETTTDMIDHASDAVRYVLELIDEARSVGGLLEAA